MEPPFEISECHLSGCKRGELLLTNEEMDKLNAYLASRSSVEGAPQWRFISVPGSARGLKLPSVQHPKPASTQTAPAPRASAPAKKQLPDWALTFHRMLHKFLQDDVAKPFADRLPHHSEEIRIADGGGVAVDLCQPVTRHSIHNQHQKDIQLVSQPIPGIVSPKQVLYKIESGGYPNCLAAFNDLYNFFLCGFRHYPPASPHWMLLHNVVTLFFTNLGAFPLKDSFEGPPSILQEKERRAPSAAGAPERRVEKSNVSVPTNTHRILRTPLSHDAPVKRKETRALHRILAALSPGLHSMLYEHFKDKAVWKASEDGQVQLDEENTPAPVFREILTWGASRVTWQVSSGKKKQPKIAVPAPTAPAVPAAPFAEEHEPPPPPPDQPRRYEGWLSSSDSNRAQTSSSDDDDSEDERAAPTTAHFESSDGD